MYKNKKILGIIPARGGSKGLPGKNVRKLASVPLIGWTIQRVRESRYFDRAIVSTDDLQIANIAKKYKGDVPFLRPKKFARVSSPIMGAIQHAIESLAEEGQRYDYVAWLEPTSPLRKKEDLDKAVKLLIDHSRRADSLVSVGQVHTEHPSIVKRIKRGFVVPYVSNLKMVKRRQDCDSAYFPYGVIYLSRVKSLLKTGTFYQKRTIPYLIERWQNYEIDDLYDFYCVEAILKKEIIETFAKFP